MENDYQLDLGLQRHLLKHCYTEYWYSKNNTTPNHKLIYFEKYIETTHTPHRCYQIHR